MELIERIEVKELEGIDRNRVKYKEKEEYELIGEGLKVGNGAITGRVAFNLEDIQNMNGNAILIRWLTNANDI